MWFFYSGPVVFVLFAAFCVWRVRTGYASEGRLSTPTVVSVWGLYLLHAAFTAHAAWRGVWPLPLDRPLAMAFGALLVILGSGIATAGISTFHSIESMSGQQTDQLVTTGIFRWSRNPQNVGWFLALLCWALA